jgi:hypothetical protein
MSWLTDLLREYPALSVAKERLVLLQDKMQVLGDENEKLKKENDELRMQVVELKKQLERYIKEEVFIEDSGVLFKKKLDGNFENFAYCPTCKQAMSEFPPRSNELLICTKCNYQAPFLPNKLNFIRNRVAQEYYKAKTKK